MLDFSIKFASFYDRKETYRQTVNCPWLILNFRGLRQHRLYFPGDKTALEQDNLAPWIGIRLPGMVIDFSYDDSRENWVIMLDNFPVRYDAKLRQPEIFCGEWIPFPLTVYLPEERIPSWRPELRKITEGYTDPTPVNVMKSKLSVMNILRYMLDSRSDITGESPEERLKQLIDKDFTVPLSCLSGKCGVSKDHLRILFYRRYKIRPLEYRQQKRNAFIMELVAGSMLSVKEIALKAGYKHSSHFCMDFHKNFGIYPMEAIRKYRYRSQ